MKKKEEPPSITVEPVHLPAVWGMQPGVYLTIIYAIVFLLALFLVGFLPGILKGGKRVAFTSQVEPTAVYVDGSYVGSAPTTSFISSGTHDIEFSFNGIVTDSMQVEIAHPVFFTWLFPRTQAIAANLTLETESQVTLYLRQMEAEVFSWSSITDFSETYHYPPLMLRAARTLSASEAAKNTAEGMVDSFSRCLRFITSETLLEDAKAALVVLTDSGLLTSSQIDGLQHDISKTALLYDDITEETGASYRDTKIMPTISGLVFDTVNSTSIPGFSYTGGGFVMGEKAPADYPGIIRMGVERQVGDFCISALEISEYQWALFMADNPYWAKENLELLVADGKTDGNYLAGLYPSTSVISNRPIKNISWYAAQAFCNWLSQKSGKTVTLPSEAQWEYAARSVAFRSYQSNNTMVADNKGPVGMLGSYWEFTSDAFIPLQRYLGTISSGDVEVPEVIVKGGSLVNDSKNITVATIGVQSRTACSEFTGVRIVWNE